MLTPASYLREHVLDMSQTELAARLGCSQPNISIWERKTNKPKSGIVPPQWREKFKEVAAELGKTIPDEDFESLPFKRGKK